MSLKKKVLLGAGIVVLVIAVACGMYINDFYRAGSHAVEVAAAAAADYTCMERESTLVFQPEGEAEAGLIFYPGGKVEYTAYAPLMEALAERGVLCILIEMPGNLAVLDVNAADDCQAEFPEIEHWYIGGHSLGGSMAASYVSEHVDQFDGLLLLAAYSTADLTESGLDVLSVYGSEDSVLNMSKYDEYRQNLPHGEIGDADGEAGGTGEVIIQGGNHAGFGDYGAQEGDGDAAISGESQREQTAAAFAEILPGRKDAWSGQDMRDEQEEQK